jgi:hypothetical protein
MQSEPMMRRKGAGNILKWVLSPLAFLWVGIALCEPLSELPQAMNMGSSLMDPASAKVINLGPLDGIKISAVGSGFGLSQTNPAVENSNTILDISNAQLIVQKDTGDLQFYLQAGYYSTPSLGTSYQRANRQTIDSFGVLPLAYVAAPIGSNWKLSAGKINSFGGYENTFTFQNANIDRGLLWNQTSNVSKGVEAAYKDGAISTAVTINDGFYSNQLSWMGASFAYQLNQKSTATLSWTGAIKPSSTNTFVTPLAQNNSQIVNAIYTLSKGNWFIAPYLQYTYVPANPAIGILSSANTMGAALLTNYRLMNFVNDGGIASIPVRLEYIGSSGYGNPSSPNLLYGPGSSAWSVTVTPTIQFKQYFFRAEYSYVQASNITPGLGFGQQATANNQSRLMFETGFLY